MKIKRGDKIQWVGRFTKKTFDCIVSNVKRKDGLIRIVADPEGKNKNGSPKHPLYIKTETTFSNYDN